ncbi:MAG: hypothetical protein RugAbin2_02413 [Rugosibacter sp.]|nr:hypothetical protein [Rugosibacter sp.]
MESTTSWGDWVQDIGKTLVKGYADYKVYLPAQQATQEINQLGEAGYYNAGQRGTSQASSGRIAGVPTAWLLLGGLVVVVLLIKA